MMNDEEFSSDSSDEDYVPEENIGLSEEEDSGDDEEIHGEGEADIGETVSGKASGKRKGNKKFGKRKNAENTIVPRKRRGGIHLEGDESSPSAPADTPGASEIRLGGATVVEQEREREQERLEEQKKKKVDDLWADFLKDTSSARPKSNVTAASIDASAVASNAKSSSSISSASSTSSNSQSESSKDKVTIVKEFKFAGETVKMETTVDANSKEAKQHSALTSTTTSKPVTAGGPVSVLGIKRPGGLSSVLGKLDKKPKMSTLVKSKLDWDGFKAKEGIDEELKIHNRGKDGYLEKQAFLERTDHRQFEIERNIRLSSASKKN